MRITNAQQAGTYTIKVKNVVFDLDYGTDPPTTISGRQTTFSLLITNPAAPSGVVIKNPTDASVGANANSVAIGDFDGDGNQDLAVSNNQEGTARSAWATEVVALVARPTCRWGRIQVV